MSMHGIEKLERKPKGTIESSFEAWQNGKIVSNVLQMSMKLFVTMILLKLQHPSRSFQRKPLQQQAEVGQQSEPPRIGTGQVQPPPPPRLSSMWEAQPQGMFHPSTTTPMTPSYPPHPPIEALPKPAQEVASPATLKHPLPQPGSAQQASTP